MRPDAPANENALTRDDLERLEAELPPLLTEREVAELFQVHPKTIARWSHEGMLPPPLLLRDGKPSQRRKRYPRDVILRQLAKLAGLLALGLVVVGFPPFFSS